MGAGQRKYSRLQRFSLRRPFFNFDDPVPIPWWMTLLEIGPNVLDGTTIKKRRFFIGGGEPRNAERRTAAVAPERGRSFAVPVGPHQVYVLCSVGQIQNESQCGIGDVEGCH